MGTAESKVRDFTRMNPPDDYDSKGEDDPQEFIVEVHKVSMIIAMTLVGKVELSLINLRVFFKCGLTNRKGKSEDVFPLN